MGHRRTDQREAILAVLRQTDGPLTVHEILTRALTQAPGLGIATVYRTVRLLEADHLIRSVLLSDGQSRYERADLADHLHFHCRVCDRVYDMPPDTAGSLPRPADLPVPDGFRVDRQELNLYGICSGCDDAEDARGGAGNGASAS